MACCESSWDNLVELNEMVIDDVPCHMGLRSISTIIPTSKIQRRGFEYANLGDTSDIFFFKLKLSMIVISWEFRLRYFDA
jgi:hypothetical protein